MTKLFRICHSPNKQKHDFSVNISLNNVCRSIGSERILLECFPLHGLCACTFAQPRALWEGAILKLQHNMLSTKMFGLFIWIHDDPILGNVLNLSNITEPRKQFEDYAEGDLVKTKCPGFGIVEGVIGKIVGKFVHYYYIYSIQYA